MLSHFYPVSVPLRQVLLLSDFRGEESEALSERLDNLPKALRQLSAGTHTHSHQSDSRVHSACHHTELPKHVPGRV